MKTRILLSTILAATLILALGVSVLYDTKSSYGACKNINNSVCTAQSSCPDGFVATLDYTCSMQEMTCCVPNTRE